MKKRTLIIIAVVVVAVIAVLALKPFSKKEAAVTGSGSVNLSGGNLQQVKSA